MYFWKYKKLASDFVDNKITEKQKLMYVFIPAFFTLFGLLLRLIIPGLDIKNSPAWSALSETVTVVTAATELFFTLMIMLYAYKLNREADNKDLIARYFAFKFVSMIRTVAIVVWLTILFVLLKGFTGEIIIVKTYEIVTIFIISVFYSCYVQIAAFLHLRNCYKLNIKSVGKTITKRSVFASMSTKKVTNSKQALSKKKDSKKKVAKNAQIKRR